VGVYFFPALSSYPVCKFIICNTAQKNDRIDSPFIKGIDGATVWDAVFGAVVSEGKVFTLFISMLTDIQPS
jgi:hypothetical protein